MYGRGREDCAGVRRLAAEAVGTVGAIAGKQDLLAHSLAPALVVAGMIYALGSISGAHLNPAVTLAFACRRDFPWSRVAGYWIAQLGGAKCAAFLLSRWYGDAVNGGVNRLGPQVSALSGLGIEAALTTMRACGSTSWDRSRGHSPR